MKTLTNEAFAARVLELAQPAEKFTPTAYYDPDGDCIEFLAQPDNFYAERVDSLVTVYVSEQTGAIIGSLLKGVKSLCNQLLERLPGFKIEIRHGKVKLVHIFLAKFRPPDIGVESPAKIRFIECECVENNEGFFRNQERLCSVSPLMD